jgi:hypothetical protein
MSELGQSRLFADGPTTSGLSLRTDIGNISRHVSKVSILSQKSAEISRERSTTEVAASFALDTGREMSRLRHERKSGVRTRFI